jgi:hypothetical protein
MVVEGSAAVGRSWIVPDSPARLRFDVSADAPGWERFEAFARRLRGGGRPPGCRPPNEVLQPTGHAIDGRLALAYPPT